MSTAHVYATQALESLIGPDGAQALRDNGLVVVNRRTFYTLLRQAGEPAKRFKHLLRHDLVKLAGKLWSGYFLRPCDRGGHATSEQVNFL
ncbi:MAG: hypothetical protein AB9900_10890 [Humidesulfovibrio sp.]